MKEKKMTTKREKQPRKPAAEKKMAVMQEKDLQKTTAVARIMNILAKTGTYLFLFAMALIVLFPFYWMIISSLKTMDEYRKPIPTMFPQTVQTNRYYLINTNLETGSVEVADETPEECYYWDMNNPTPLYYHNKKNAYYMGMQKGENAFGIYNTKEITGENAGAVGTTRFPVHLYEEVQITPQVGADVTMESGSVVGYDKTEIWKVTKNSDGTYSFARGGKKIAMLPELVNMKQGELNDDWSLELQNGTLLRIKNTSCGGYMVWDASEECWRTTKPEDAASVDQVDLSIYVVGKGLLGASAADSTQKAIELNANDEIVIFAPAYNKALSSELAEVSPEIGVKLIDNPVKNRDYNLGVDLGAGKKLFFNGQFTEDGRMATTENRDEAAIVSTERPDTTKQKNGQEVGRPVSLYIKDGEARTYIRTFHEDTGKVPYSLPTNYVDAFQTGTLGKLFMNTLYVGVVSTILSLIITVLSAFAFARLEFKGKDTLFGALLATMMIPGELFTITNYITVSKFGWINSFTALIVPFLVSVFYIYLLRQNFQQIPNELYLAAKVDGTSDLKYLWKVMVPLALPTLISITILKMMGAWNTYIWPNLVARHEDYHLITNGLRNAFTTVDGDVNIPVQMAAVAIVSAPLFMVFLFLRKYIMAGVSRSGIKG